jgi:hypothetical protein
MASSFSTSEAFRRLADHYIHRLDAARSAKAAGQRVVGRIGHLVPVEPIIAAGCMPVLVSADLKIDTPQADLYIDPELPAETRALCEAGLQGTFEFLDLLVLSRQYDKLYYFMKELHRLGQAPQLPPFAIYDLMHSQRDAVQAYNQGRFRALIERLGRVGSRAVEPASLAEAIALTNEVRTLQHRLAERRLQGQLSGVEALQIIGAGFFMQPAHYLADLRACVDALDRQQAPDAVPGVRAVLASSEPLQDLVLHQALADAGVNVVAEDDAWGSRAAGQPIPQQGDPAGAILDKLWRDTQSSGVWPPQAREAWLLAQAAQPAVQAAILYVPPSDRLLGWDAPRLLRTWRDAGQPALALFQDVHRPEGRAALVEEVRAFAAGIHRPSHQEAAL